MKEAQSLSEQVQGYLLSFFKNVSLNKNNLNWPISKGTHRSVLIFDKELKIEEFF
ncbi:hypothetical protein IGI01_12640 [Bacillus thuringiensis]|nr:hypothetical protein [Bacillus thuringiensis]